MRTTLVATAAFCALFAHQASAQPGKKDHRKHKPAEAAQVRSMVPASGAPGTTVRLDGVGLPDSATVVIGRRRVQATQAGRRGNALTFVVPDDMRPGSRKVSIEIDGVMVDAGDFEVTAGDGAPPPIMPPAGASIAVGEPHPGAPPARTSRRRWSSYQIPVVNSYFPDKGDVGTTVTVNGANFTPSLRVFLGDTEITDIRFTPTTIVFKIPKGATDGVITVRGAGNRRALAVGQFQVVEFDFKAARRKRDGEHRKAAEEAWKQRRQHLGKDRAARRKAIADREAELAASRDHRRRERLEAIRAKFKAAFLADEETQAELSLHAERLARLERMMRLAEANDDGKLAVRIEIAIKRENERHDSRMATLEAAFRAP